MSEFATDISLVAVVPLFGLAFLFVSAALGRRILIWIGHVPGATLAERALTATALGTGALQLLPLALGALGALRPSVLVAVSLLVAALLSLDAWSWSKRVAPTATGWPRIGVKPWFIALLPGIWGVALLALAPTIDTDGLIYHLTVPKRWLDDGWLHYLPTYPYSNTPMGAQSLFAIALVFVGDVGAKWLNLQSALLGGVAIYLAGARLHAQSGGPLAATLAFSLFATRHSTLGSAYIDGFLVFAMSAAALSWLVWRAENSEGWLRSAALLSGFSVSFKITCVHFAFALAILTLAARPAKFAAPPGQGARRWLSSGAWVPLALLLLPVAPWMLRAGWLTGNPFFPAFASSVATRDLSAESARAFTRAMRYRNWGANFGSDLALRQQLVAGVAVLLVAGVAFCVWRWKGREARAVAVALLVAALLQLAAVGLNARLWIPLLIVFVLPLTAALKQQLARRWLPAALASAALLGSAVHLRKVDNEVQLSRLIRAPFSAAQRRSVLLTGRPTVPVNEWVNANLPRDSRVLLLFFSTGFYVDRTTFVADFVQDALRFGSVAQFMGDAHALGITHIVRPVALEDPRDSLIDKPRQFAIACRVTAEYGQLLARVGDAEVYQLRAAPSAISLSP